ncbi:MAG: trigger factor [Methyloligellaceae bacterium]
MEVTESTSEGLKRELKVVVAAEELNKRLSDRLNEMKSNVRLKGFRPGKVPVDHLRKIYGRSVMAEIVQQMVQETSEKAIAERDERPAVPPDVSLTEDQEEIEKLISGQSDLAYTLSFEVLPEIKITDLSKLKLEKPVVEVTEKDVEEALERLVSERVTYSEKDGPAEEGDQVVVDFEGRIDGVPFDGGKAEDAQIVIGSKLFIPGFEEGLLGAKAGDERKLEITFPEDYASTHLAGKDAVFDVKVKSVGAPQRPEVDADFAAALGFGTVELLEEGIKEQLQKELEQYSRLRVKRQILDILDKEHKFEVPQSLVDHEFDAIWQRITSQLENAGRSFEDEGTTEEEERKRYREIAERRVRLGLVISEIGNSTEIEITEDEVNKALMERLRQFPGQEQQVYEFYQKHPNALADLRAPIYEDKVIDYILELAEVSEKPVSREELLAMPEDDEDVL